MREAEATYIRRFASRRVKPPPGVIDSLRLAQGFTGSLGEAMSGILAAMCPDDDPSSDSPCHEEDPIDFVDEEEKIPAESFDWSCDYEIFCGRPEPYLNASNCGTNIEETDPLKLVTHVWDYNIMSLIVAQTNEYAWQQISQAAESVDGISANSRINDWVETTTDDNNFIGFLGS
ncbi:unnamed protein product [Leptosia nina]|uniref:Uncharacterized protein n=1 Tax=Leptosia nina TaxID=320188 RepID=A0AAV1JWV1_9NEOP